MIRKGRYVSYLLRLWQESGGSPPGDPPGESLVWRASLESPRGGERLGFAGLEDLFAYLENETRSSAPGSEHSEGEGR